VRPWIFSVHVWNRVRLLARGKTVITALPALIGTLILVVYCCRLRDERAIYKEDFRHLARRAARAERERDALIAERSRDVAVFWHVVGEQVEGERWKESN
jgi:hypothetical protein